MKLGLSLKSASSRSHRSVPTRQSETGTNFEEDFVEEFPTKSWTVSQFLNGAAWHLTELDSNSTEQFLYLTIDIRLTVVLTVVLKVDWQWSDIRLTLD